MKHVRWLLVVIGMISLMGFRHWSGESRLHTVARVFDGDTILINDGRKVRLAGVDAPEVDSPYSREEPGGPQSRAYLKALIEGRKVAVRVGREPYDRYGRTLAFVYLDDVLVNGRIIRDGLARAYRRFDYPSLQGPLHRLRGRGEGQGHRDMERLGPRRPGMGKGQIRAGPVGSPSGLAFPSARPGVS
jgi:hypothetical protein